MKTIFSLHMAIGLLCPALGQTIVSVQYPVSSEQPVHLKFEYPELVSISTWQKDSIKLIAHVSINRGLNDEAFTFEVDQSPTFRIQSSIEKYDQLPERILLSYAGEEVFFDTDNIDDPMIEAYKLKVGAERFDYMQRGVIKEITIQIFVPSYLQMQVTSKFALVELINCTSAVSVNSKFGGVDATIDPANDLMLTIETKFGEVYSNLRVPFEGKRADIGRWGTLSTSLGNGAVSQIYSSEFGNVYLRRSTIE